MQGTASSGDVQGGIAAEGAKVCEEQIKPAIGQLDVVFISVRLESTRQWLQSMQ